MRIAAALVCCLVVTAPGCRRDEPEKLPAHSVTSVPDEDTTLGTLITDSLAHSAARFTQQFYVWYRQRNDRMDRAITEGAAFFSPELLAALRADEAASARSQEVVGLDWDPFTASQDMCDPYTVGRTTRRGDTVLVAVKGMCRDMAPKPGPDVIAELRRAGASWVFVNFRYVSPVRNLLADLDTLRREREHNSRSRRP
jgi:hypothetical protein